MVKENPLINCECGCGGQLLKYDKRGRERKFLPSHWANVQPNKREVVICEYCGKNFERPQWHIKRVQHHFCDAMCEGAWSSINERRRGANNGHYNTITVPCSGCGEPVSKAKSLIERRYGRVYCANCVKLVRKGRNGFYVGYPPEFSNKLRKQIRSRDAYTCQLCHKHQDETGTLHVHHIDYNKANNDQQNLIALCRVCHGLTNFGLDEWKVRFQQFMHDRLLQLPPQCK